MTTQKRIEYWTTIGRLNEKKQANADLYASLQKKSSKSEMAISVDITRTFPSLEFFKYGKKGYAQLSRVLKAVSLVFPNIGYCQGMNFFSAIILLILGNEEVLNSGITENIGIVLDGGGAAQEVQVCRVPLHRTRPHQARLLPARLSRPALSAGPAPILGTYHRIQSANLRRNMNSRRSSMPRSGSSRCSPMICPSKS